jgi:hypothetical protein
MFASAQEGTAHPLGAGHDVVSSAVGAHQSLPPRSDRILAPLPVRQHLDLVYERLEPFTAGIARQLCAEAATAKLYATAFVTARTPKCARDINSSAGRPTLATCRA